MDEAMLELHRKVDLLAGQVSLLTEEAERASRQRQDRAELLRDLAPLADQAYQMAIQQLEEVQEYVDLADLLRLFKRLLRNGRNLERMLDQLEAVVDLAETVGPLADEAFGKVIDALTVLEEKGYFAFARGGRRMIDNVVRSFTEEDVSRLGDNVVLILNTVKDMTQPEVLHFVRNTLLVAEKEVEKPVDTSYRGLVRQMQDPAVRRGLALILRVLHVVGAQAGEASAPAAIAPSLNAAAH